jgi:NAD(P)-dependent dehydrogenase (short-subunit alcohol dehydrogenase family)
MPITFEGQVAIITGGAGGLGKAYANEIVRRGGAVLVNDTGGNVDGSNNSIVAALEVASVLKAIGGKAQANADTVATEEGAQAIINAALEHFGRVDIIIHSAGNLRNAPIADLRNEDRDSVLAVHLLGAFNLTKIAFPLMQRQGYGRIVYTSSASGLFGNPQQSAYGAAKAGLLGLNRIVALEGQAHGILANLLAPQAATRMAANMDENETAALLDISRHFGQAINPQWVAPLAVFLASRECNVTGEAYSAVGGRYSRIFVGLTEGWLGTQDTPASIDDVHHHFDEIRSTDVYTIPSCLKDELKSVAEFRQRKPQR